MIIDSHTYCFKSANDSYGYKNQSEHIAWIQQANAQHHQPAIKISDRNPEDNNGLSLKENKLSNLSKVNFKNILLLIQIRYMKHLPKLKK